MLRKTNPTEIERYQQSLFPQAEAQQGRCTSNAASISAGVMIHQFTRYLRDLPTDQDSTINLFSAEWNIRQPNQGETFGSTTQTEQCLCQRSTHHRRSVWPVTGKLDRLYDRGDHSDRQFDLPGRYSPKQ